MDKTKLYTHDARQLHVVWGVTELEDFERGEYLTIKQTAPRFKSLLGLGGAVVPIMSKDKRALAELKIMKESPKNAILSAQSKADEFTGKVVLPFMVRDTSGNDLYFSPVSRIVGDPTVSRGTDTTSNTWVFELYQFIPFHGGQ